MAVRKAQRQARDAFSQFTGNAGQERRRTGGWTGGKKRRNKVIDRNVGEYVDFEEVETSGEAGTKPEAGDTTKSGYKVEQQVVDAEWEDIK